VTATSPVEMSGSIEPLRTTKPVQPRRTGATAAKTIVSSAAR
jgi:hypothetical protein